MSVHPQAVPDWSRHELSERFKINVRRAASKLYLDDIDADAIAEKVALGMCIEGNFLRGEPSRVFWARIKNELYRMSEIRLQERSRQDSEAWDGTDVEDAATYLMDRHVVELPRQEDYTYLMEVLEIMGRLPKKYQSEMRRLVQGDNVLDIAKTSGDDVNNILDRIHFAREWIRDHAEWGYDK